MVLSCEIRFDQNAHGVYFSGQLLSGTVILNLDKTKTLKGICLRISGRAQCAWSETQTTGAGKDRRTNTIHYSGREDYIATSSYLVPVNVAGSQDIPAGKHTYTFACALPPQLPTSFEGAYGHIRYTMRVILERPWKFDQTYKVAFTVLKELDLNLESPMLRIPTQLEFMKNFCCGPCRSGPLSIVATIPQSGYVPGQSIAVNARIVNGSNVDIDYMRFTLRKTIAYNSQTPCTKTKFDVETIQEQRTAGAKKSVNVVYDVELVVPPVPPSNFGQCRVIHVSYEVKVEAKCGGPHHSPYILIPVTIGTRPLRSSPPNPSAQLLQHNYGFVMPQGDCGVVANPLAVSGEAALALPTAPEILTPTPPAVQIRDYSSSAPDDLPPPTYEETMHGNRLIEDDEDTHPIGRQSYTPRYPVYNFEDSAKPAMMMKN